MVSHPWVPALGWSSNPFLQALPRQGFFMVQLLTAITVAAPSTEGHPW